MINKVKTLVFPRVMLSRIETPGVRASEEAAGRVPQEETGSAEEAEEAEGRRGGRHKETTEGLRGSTRSHGTFTFSYYKTPISRDQFPSSVNILQGHSIVHRWCL